MAGKKTAHRIGKGESETLILEGTGSFAREIAVGEGASADIMVVNFAPEKEDAACSVGLKIGKNASVNFLNCNFGGKETGSAVKIAQKEGSRCRHFEVALLSGSQRLFSRTWHLHDSKKTFSRSSFRYVAAGSSRIDSEGNVTLAKKAKGADAHLAARSLLLSSDAIVKVTPVLRVWNSDVAAGHGAAMAPIPADELFYLNARGIDDADGRRMILLGFLSGPAMAGGMGRKTVAKLRALLERKMGGAMDI